MPDTAQQVVEVARPVGHRRAGEEIDLVRTGERSAGVGRHAEQLEAVRCARAVVLDEVRLVQDDAGPGHGAQALRVLGEQIIVDDDPARILVGRSSRADHLDPCGGIDHADLAPPVQLERCRADDEDRPVRRRDLHGGDRLAGLAEAHVVAEDGASLRNEECHAVGLMRVQQTRRQATDALEMRDGNNAHVLGLSFVCDIAASGR